MDLERCHFDGLVSGKRLTALPPFVAGATSTTKGAAPCRLKKLTKFNLPAIMARIYRRWQSATAKRQTPPSMDAGEAGSAVTVSPSLEK